MVYVYKFYFSFKESDFYLVRATLHVSWHPKEEGGCSVITDINYLTGKGKVNSKSVGNRGIENFTINNQYPISLKDFRLYSKYDPFEDSVLDPQWIKR
jgi:hypothetical protein